MKKIKKPFALCSLMYLSPACVNASIMTFGNGLAIGPIGYSESGMQITSTSTSSISLITDWQSLPSSPDFATHTGEREMLFTQFDPVYTFSLTSGKRFDLVGLDIENPAGTGASWGAFDLFTVMGSNGVSIVNDSENYGTVSFGSSLTGITSFTLETNFQTAIDNIEFEISAIPVPASLWLLATGMITLLGFSRRPEKSV